VSEKEPAVAIDGPAGAGKSSVSRRVAHRLGYVLLDTGALYRCVALAAQRRAVDWGDPAAVGVVARELASSPGIAFVQREGRPQQVLLFGEDVSEAIRTEPMGQGASRVSAIPEVRLALLEIQRAGARSGGVVLEGRDIGTVVLPDAEAKFFLTASVDTRATRRRTELLGKGQTVSFETVRRDVIERDERDTNRAVAPLRQAADAVVVDSTDLTLDQVVDRIVAHVERIRNRP
jgi:cytidylate kinase